MDAVQVQPEAEARATIRSNMFLAAVLQGPGFAAPVKVRNMSATGALVEAESLPETGEAVRLGRGSLAIAAVVAWSAPGRCGLRFASPVIVREWLAPPANAAQQRVDAAIGILKLGAIPIPRSETARPRSPALPELGHDLERATRLIEDVGNALSSDADVVSRYSETLQNVDLALQLISAVATALISGGDELTADRLQNLRASALQARPR